MLKDLFVNEQRPLIPIVLDADVKVPPLLRVHSRLRADQIPELIAAIEGRTAKPTRGEIRDKPPAIRFQIALRDLPDGAIGVSAKIDGTPLAPETPVRTDPEFHFSYSDFLRSVPTARMGGPNERAATRARELRKLGDAVGRVVFTGTIAQQLSARIGEASHTNQDVELLYAAAEPRLLSIPFEAACLPDGSIPALLPGVFTTRRLASSASRQNLRQDPAPGPLRVLVAVGAPDEGKTSNVVLDSERELQTILDALDPARRLENAYVRVLEVGSPQQIGSALRERSYHVLHLSGHGSQGFLELEDEDGQPLKTDAAALAKEIRESGHSAPLVFLASCHGGLGDQGKAAFAQGLLESGVPSVLAMQTTVSDWYATELAGRFYQELSRAEQPLPSRALALARRQLEEQRQSKNSQGPTEGLLPEYATPSLFLRGDEQPLLNRGLQQPSVPEPKPPLSADAVPLLAVGELIGRRPQMRELVRGLNYGKQAGAQILGTGGVGKSALAGRVMQRMADRGWPVATVSGTWNIAKIATKLGAALWDHSQPGLAKLAAQLNNPEAPDELRIEWLNTILAQYKVLLVLDNFEDVLTPAGSAFKDSTQRDLFAGMLRSSQSAKLLITCRYPLPGAQDQLQRVDLGPLSRAETRKLMLRCPALAQQSSEAVKQIERAIGGHPRTLEYLDALLRSGQTDVTRVQTRLAEYAEKVGISLAGSNVLEERLQDAIRVAAADAMVAELLRVLGERPADLAVLWQASVFPFAVPEKALAAAAEGVGPLELSKIVDRLVASSLVALLGDRHVVVHRWTAQSLKAYMSAEQYQQCCFKGAEYLEKRAVADRAQWVADLTESMRLFLAAGEFDRSATLTWQLLRFLQPYGQTTVWMELLREVSAALPDGHEDKLRLIGTEGDGLLALGFAAQAHQSYSKASHLAERLVEQEPGRADYLRDLSISYDRLGDLQSALGQGETARQFYEKDLAIAERLVEQEPGRADYLRDLSVSYNKLGDLQRALGQGETARQFFEKSMEIAERLAEQEPGRADYLRDLSVSYNKLGDLQRALGQGETARQFYEKALAIRERLVEQEPGRADYLRDLSVSYNKLGDLQSALGQGETARQFYEQALAIAERLVEQEPGRADYLRDLSISYERLGDLQSALGQGETARRLYEQSLAIRERLVEQEPGRADYQVDLAKALARMGDAASIRRASTILRLLKESNTLMPQDERFSEYVQELMQTQAAKA